jgi:hypothetical protein
MLEVVRQNFKTGEWPKSYMELAGVGTPKEFLELEKLEATKKIQALHPRTELEAASALAAKEAAQKERARARAREKKAAAQVAKQLENVPIKRAKE